jgi:hypothetical protein
MEMVFLGEVRRDEAKLNLLKGPQSAQHAALYRGNAHR